jgi:HD-GYP domain-containing protein (c-di-GMP phosphodiesterase class II)
MVPLRRLLKKRALAPLLERARQMLGPGWLVTVLDAADPLAPTVCHVEALRLGGNLLGYLAVSAPPEQNAQDRNEEHLRATVRFVADCLETLIDGEALRRTLASETLSKYREVSLLHRATSCLNGSLRPRDVALALLAECRHGELPADVGMVFLCDPADAVYAPVGSFGQAAARRLDNIAASALFQAICNSHKGEIINDLAADKRWADEAEIASLLLYPLLSTGKCVGMLVLAGPAPMLFEASHLQHVGTLAAVAGIAMGNALHFKSVQTLINSLMQALATAIDARDPFTSGHSQRVARLGVALARAVHGDDTAFAHVTFTPSDLEEILYAGLLHDVGKIGIREEVLTKATRISTAAMDVIAQRLALYGHAAGRDMTEALAELARINAADAVTEADAAIVTSLAGLEIAGPHGPLPVLTPFEADCLRIPRGNLTPEERLEIERHPEESHRILQHIPFPENMARLLAIISQHHERLDGSGYPEKLRGEAILLQSRIIAIVDIYDAITMARHYKPALSRERALAVLREEADRGRIDDALVNLLAANIAAVERDSARLESSPDLGDFLLAPFPDRL